MKVDPVTTEVVASRLREIASTMEYALYHSGYSPILRESKDGTAGLTDPAGRVYGVEGLRVCDASIMPAVPCANTNIPTIMVGEKIAAAIMEAQH
mgnify:CR=1 FL=1